MIIKVTFFDNDYGEVLEEIGKEWQGAFHLMWCAKCASDLPRYIKTEPLWSTVIRNPNYRRRELMNINGSDYTEIINIIKEWIHTWLKIHYPNESESLINSLHVSLTMDFDDDWQNGENLYYFVKDNVSVIR
jgi:hypothetical protein